MIRGQIIINNYTDVLDIKTAGSQVSEKSGIWIYKDAGREIAARDIEAIFLKKGCKGGTVKKDSSRFVYVYKMIRTSNRPVK